MPVTREQLITRMVSKGLPQEAAEAAASEEILKDINAKGVSLDDVGTRRPAVRLVNDLGTEHEFTQDGLNTMTMVLKMLGAWASEDSASFRRFRRWALRATIKADPDRASTYTDLIIEMTPDSLKWIIRALTPVIERPDEPGPGSQDKAS